MSSMSFEEAAGALQAANDQDRAEQAPAPDAPEASEGTTPAESFITDEDLNALRSELSPQDQAQFDEAYRGMQSHFTKRTQQIGPLAKLVEQGVDPNEITAAVQFYDQLRSDPGFAMGVHKELTDLLTGAGYSPYMAQQTAAQAIVDVQDGTDDSGEDWDEDSEEDGNSELYGEMDDLRARLDKFESEKVMNDTLAELQRQEMAIRQNHPEYTDEDVVDIYKRSFAVGGDLFAAENELRAYNQRVISKYMEQKGNVPSPAHNLQSSGPAQQPKNIKSVDEGHKLAEAYLAQVLAAGGE